MIYTKRRTGWAVGQAPAPASPFRPFAVHEIIPPERIFVVAVAGPRGTNVNALKAAMDRVETLEGVVNFPDALTRKTGELEDGSVYVLEGFMAAIHVRLDATTVVDRLGDVPRRGIYDSGRDAIGAGASIELARQIGRAIAEAPETATAGVQIARELMGVVRAAAQAAASPWGLILGAAAAVALAGTFAYVATRGRER